MQDQLKRKTGEIATEKAKRARLEYHKGELQKETDRLKYQKGELQNRVETLMTSCEKHKKLDEEQRGLNERRQETGRQHQRYLEQWKQVDRQR